MKEWIIQFFNNQSYSSFNIFYYWKTSSIKSLHFLSLLNEWFNEKKLNIENIQLLRNEILKDYPAIFLNLHFLKKINMKYNFFIFNLILLDDFNKKELLDYYSNKFFLNNEILSIVENIYENKIIRINNSENFIIKDNNKFIDNIFELEYFIDGNDFIKDNIFIKGK